MIANNKAEFEKMNLDIWHKAGFKGKGAKVVVLDSTHRPYAHTNVIDPFNDNIDKAGHKSHVAQTIRELAPEADIVVFSWFGGRKQETVDWIKEHESKICAICCSFNTAVGTDIFEQLEGVDIPILNATGNNSDDKIGRGANYPWTIAVGAWEEHRDNRARYSNYGEGLDLVAYTNIYITTESSNNLMFNGTSCAAPVTTAILAIYNGWLNDHGLTKLSRDEAKGFLRQHSLDKLDEGYDFESGHGLAALPKDIPVIEIEEPVPPVIEEPIQEEDDIVPELNDIKGHWAEQYIQYVVDKGWMKGYEEGVVSPEDDVFRPDKALTRAEFAAVVARMDGFTPKK